LKVTSKKAFMVIKRILADPEFSQREVAKETGVGLGYVNEVVNYLVSIGVVYRKNHYILGDPIRLLEKISFDRPLASLELNHFRMPTSTVDETEQMISETLEMENVSYAFTGFSGLRRYFEYHISYPKVHFYVPDGRGVVGLEQGEGPVEVVALRADMGSILDEAEVVRGVRVCSREQVIIDLFSSGIGRDAAIKFLEATRLGSA
jgi:hypothetical protein